MDKNVFSWSHVSGRCKWGIVCTKSFRKVTAGNIPLMAVNCHPRHCIKAFSVGKQTGIHSKCSIEDSFCSNCLGTMDGIRERGIPRWKLNKVYTIVEFKSRFKSHK